MHDDPAHGVTIGPIGNDFGRWDELLALIRASFAYMDGVIDPPSSAHRLTADGLRDKARAETGFVATLGTRLAGCAFIAEREDHFYLGKLAVAPAFQGTGIGARLVAAAEAFALRHGKPVIELQTRVELTDNHAAFARLGFRETGRTAHAGYPRPTSVTMRKDLA
ncbi:MAG: GNAT family N-acetyltransferase [Rhizobiaceae bacterium]|nr:GNAT family N-acetyltransferase [Rhizobiaceae bacterium]